MSICYIDAFSGIAGDMLVGALVDAGADRAVISHALDSLAVGARIEYDRVHRRSVSAMKFRVTAPEPAKHRHLSGILRLIDAADIPAGAKSKAEKIFRSLGEAEAAVHGVNIEKVHFHEVGAVDSICDIVGVSLAIELLGVEEIHCSAINVGSGTVTTEHGVLPVPAPATARLLRDKPIYSRGPALELTTPTGAAVVSALAAGFGAMPAMRVQSIGYGAGDHDFAEHANVVRVMVGEATSASEATTVTIIEASIDDASPQLIGYAMELMLDAGALDAIVIPAQMKKGRPGVLVQVIAEHHKREELAAILFRETTTLGIRFHTAERLVQPREFVERPDATRSRPRQIRRQRLCSGIRRRAQNRRHLWCAPEAGHPRGGQRLLQPQEEMKYYLTTPIYYVNAAPHIGHTYTTLAADSIKRFKRMQGYKVDLTTGTDEHGQKVERSAQAAGKTPEEFTTLVSNEFRAQWDTLGIQYDHFIRTTDPKHHETVRWLFERCKANGYVYKGSYTGQYCVFDELYVNDAKPGDPCPDCGRPTETVTEENYFFKLSAFTERLLKHYEDNPDFIAPESRRNEVLSVRAGRPAGSFHHAAPRSNGAFRSKARMSPTSGSTR